MMTDHPATAADRDTLLEALGRGLMAKDRHDWRTGATEAAQWENLGIHYRRDAERFLLPLLEPLLARVGGGSQ